MVKMFDEGDTKKLPAIICGDFNNSGIRGEVPLTNSLEVNQGVQSFHKQSEIPIDWKFIEYLNHIVDKT